MNTISEKLDRLVDIVRFTQEFREVLRYAGHPLAGKPENDAEHSYQVAFAAWFVIDQEKLSLSKELCFMYALAHDLVEVYAGDTPTYDREHTSSKHDREVEALKKIKERFSHFTELISIVERYERREDPESRFIYALDKMLPPIQIYLEGGKMSHTHGISLSQIRENKKLKIAISPEIDMYWQEFLTILEQNKQHLFPNEGIQ